MFGFLVVNLLVGLNPGVAGLPLRNHALDRGLRQSCARLVPAELVAAAASAASAAAAAAAASAEATLAAAATLAPLGATAVPHPHRPAPRVPVVAPAAALAAALAAAEALVPAPVPAALAAALAAAGLAAAGLAPAGGPALVPALAAALEAASAAHSTAAPASLWHGLGSLRSQLRITLNLFQCNLRGTLLRPLLCDGNVAGPDFILPVAGKAGQLHGGLEATRNLHGLVQGLAFLQETF
mmetsp:Transcript_3792/g.8712  ORF Transcript_3792/g.8712 Transcript_3792/m.8712 type:complete len:240 (-) Transcript_3792:463-1182(-)